MLCRSSINWQQSERKPAIVAHPPAASLDEAHAAIELWEYYSRKRLDAEQRLAVELMMAESEDGRWAADTTGRAESRQNGKGDEIEVVELWGLLQRSEAILHTAHEAATAASAHARMIGLVEGHRDLRVKVKKKQSWNGNYSLILTNDGTIVWRTRTGAGGRGLDDISRIVIDEAQHAQPEELASSLPILSVNPNPQKNFVGSGGVTGKSAFWWRQRRRALSGDHGRFAWLEHSAEDVSLTSDGRIVAEVGDVADPEVWRRANPAYPSRISHDFLLDQLKTLGPELFAREHLCVWDPEPAGANVGALPGWDALAAPQVPVVDPVYGVDRDGFLVAAWTVGEVLYVELGKPVETHGIAARARQVAGSAPVACPPAMTEDLRRAGVRAVELKQSAWPQACAALLDRAASGTLRHFAQPDLSGAVRALPPRKLSSSGAPYFDLKGSPDAAAAFALVRAVWAAGQSIPSVYEDRGMLVL